MFKGAWLTQPVQLVTAGRLFLAELTEDDEEIVPDFEGSVRDFMVEEEQAANEEEETIKAEINWATADPAPKYLPLYQDPPGIDDPFVSE